MQFYRISLSRSKYPVRDCLSKQSFGLNPADSPSNFTMLWYRSDSPQIKRKVISSIANLVDELPNKLPNDLRLRILRNKEILGKSQIWVETQPNAQSHFQKLKFGNNSQKTCNSSHQNFLFLPSFTGFLYLVPNILSRIVNKILQKYL